LGRTSKIQGQRFGDLVVVDRASKLQGRDVMWLCRCDCGTEKVVRSSNITSGNTTSCGCKRGSKLKPFESLYNRLVLQANARKLDVTLTYEEFVGFTVVDQCQYECGAEIRWLPFRTEKSSPCHLDRLDNSKGYSRDNCIVCCKECNWARNNLFTPDEWSVAAKAIRAYRESKAA
jgi:hypothetical protein